MEGIVGFLLGVTISWWFWIPLSILLLVCDYRELRGDYSGWGYILAFVALIAISVNITLQWWYFVLYPFVGLAWSMWRYKRYVNFKIKQAMEENERYDEEFNREALRSQLSIVRQSDRVAYWILLWPSNMIVNVFADVWDVLVEQLKTRLARIYNSILDGEMSKQ